MASQARQFEERFTSPALTVDKDAITQHLIAAGARLGGDDVWTFRDGSPGKIPTRPIPLKNAELNIVGWLLFECLAEDPPEERSPEECPHTILEREFVNGEATMTQFCRACGKRF